MSGEAFAKFTAEKVVNMVQKPEVQNLLEQALIAESITPLVLVTSELKDVNDALASHFSTANPPIPYGIGFKTGLKTVKDAVRSSLSPDIIQSIENVCIELRQFDTPTQPGFFYQLGYCKPATGNLLIPTHEFRYKNNMNCAFIAKEVVRFAAACINGRKNGTIHFGIETSPESEKRGNIVGVPNMSGISDESINKEITHCLRQCFCLQAELVLHCVRPVQSIPVDLPGLFVYEVDVVPTPWFCPLHLISILFPPKGLQEERIFVLNQGPQCEVMTVNNTRHDDLQTFYQGVFQERIKLETSKPDCVKEIPDMKKKLSVLLAGKGNNYVTDEFVPIIISGNITGCLTEEQIRREIDLEFAFMSAKAVLDFDASTQLREQIEDNRLTFHVKTAEDFIRQEKNVFAHNPIWMYCNGNNELSMKSYEMKEWVDKRLPGVTKILETVRETIPKCRARVIFLIYDTVEKKKTPLIETARQALMSTFRDECVFIASDEKAFVTLKAEMDQIIDERMLKCRFFSGLDWTGISEVMSTVFHPNPNIVCKLPASNGQTVLMTRKEMESLKLTDIDILSGEQCKPEAANMTKKERRDHQDKMEKQFYKGGKPAEWWNFYYQNHVGKRNKFAYHEEEIKKKLNSSKGEALIEVYTIEHHPGAGGSTLARHLIWHFSQFSEEKKKYRCCLVKNITEQTVDQIERFRRFKDENTEIPFIVLVDNKNEDVVKILRLNLNEAAYKTGSPGKLFCLLLLVNRVPISEKPGKDNHLLTHQLKGKEIDWFEKKYKELENNPSVEVETLIAFNVMRQSFNPEYIKKITSEFMEHVTATEMKVLTCLSLINTYDSDHTVPPSVFDKLMQEQTNRELLSIPFGIAHSIKEKQKLAQLTCSGAGCFWKVNMSNPMSLLVTKREDDTLYTAGICIISQPLARAVLQDIIESKHITLEDVVNDILKLVKEHCHETNPMSKNFVKIVCSLFKTRQIEETDKRETKLKFSDLVLELERILDQNVVLSLMGRCFEITEDAMVGQQLARFNIHIKDFKAAEMAIQKSLSHKSRSSYLLDTYGQIFKSHMEHLLDQTKRNISDEIAAEISTLAFKAIEKFKCGQKLAIKEDDDTNIGCFHMEVKTALNFLEKFEKFDCYEKRTFLQLLNDPEFQINTSGYLHLIEKCPDIKQLKRGSQWQIELEKSLRYLEETNYQIKRHLYTVYTDDDALLLQIRERFERFYGDIIDTNKFQFRYGLGLKPIMTASKSHDRAVLEKRVSLAESNLTTKHLMCADVRDLLVYLGFYISQLSSQTNSSDTSMYHNLLRYSTRLLDMQRNEQRNSRLYLESFLYFAMLHWPLKSRLSLNLDVLGTGPTYDRVVEEWEKTYNDNHYISNQKKSQLKKPKNYFALGKGTPGNDIVDLESIKKEWMNRKGREGRYRRPVYGDNFWRENFVEERLERLDGIVDGNGHSITHHVSILCFYKVRKR